jgi:hypothetical protein
MEYLIDKPDFDGKYTREQVQALINEKKIGPNTRLWKSEWGEWRMIRYTDFDLTNSKFESISGLPENIFLSIRPFINYIDNGLLFRNPFSWLYALLAVVNLILPIYIVYQAADNRIFDAPTKFIIVFLLLWIIIAFASWVSFQLWWDRKSKVISTSSEGDEFVATPVFSHLIQTIGEWLGTWIGIVGFSVALLTTLILGDEGYYLSRQLGLGFMKTGFFFIILMPIYGFLIIVATRFLAEQFRALSSIANNTRKN